jgi:hypothetical protein
MLSNIKYVYILLLMATALPCAARENFFKKVGHQLGKLEWSQTALVGANIADAWSSSRPGLMELNSILAQRGQFSATSAVIKFSITGAQILGQRYVLTHHPRFAESTNSRTAFIIMNYTASGLYVGVAAHNLSLQ